MSIIPNMGFRSGPTLLTAASLIAVVGISAQAFAAGIITVPDNYATVKQAIDAAQEGDTIVVKPGTYLESLSITKSVNLIGSGRDTTIIGGSTVTSARVVITGFTIGQAGVAQITLVKSTGSCISENRLKTVRLEQCSGVAITDNVMLAPHDWGIYMYDSRNTVILNNSISQADAAIHIDGSSNCTLRNNSLNNNGDGLLITGWSKDHFYHDIDTSNLINGKPIRYLMNIDSVTIEPTTFADFSFLGIIGSRNIRIRNLCIEDTLTTGILLADSMNVTIENVTIRNASEAIMLAYVHDCRIEKCVITDNRRGIYSGISVTGTSVSGLQIINNRIEGRGGETEGISLTAGSSCTISGNTIRGNWRNIMLMECTGFSIRGNTIADSVEGEAWQAPSAGIALWECSGNLMYNNNWINNQRQVWIGWYPFPWPRKPNSWDNGLLSGGNYWSDYRGIDSDGDGMGDTPYVIDANDTDHYPLMRKDGWKEIKIDLSSVSKTRCDLGSIQTVHFHALWALNHSNVQSGIIYINHTSYRTDSSGWASFDYTSTSVGKTTWEVTGADYGGPVPYRQATPSPSIIWDRVDVNLSPRNKRSDVGSNALIWAARYAYDNSIFAGRIVFNDTIAKQEVGCYGYKVAAIFDDRYGLSAFRSNEASVVFDRVKIALTTLDDRLDVGKAVPIEWVGMYEYDNSPFRGAVGLNDTTIWHKVALKAYEVAWIMDPVYGLTAYRSNVVHAIFDRVSVEIVVSDSRIDVGDRAGIKATARYEYDGAPFNGSITLNTSQAMLERPGSITYTAVSISDPSYNLTAFVSNSASCIWDTVEITLTVEDGHIDVSTPAGILIHATYEYDRTAFVGSIELNDTSTKNDVGRYAYTVSNITDNLYGLSIFSANTVDVIFDTIVIDLSILDARINVGNSPVVFWSARYAYDQASLQGSIVFNEIPSPCYSVGKRSYTVASVQDRGHGLKSFQSNTVSCIFDRVDIQLSAPQRVDVATPVEIKPTAHYEYDGQPFYGQVILNDTATRFHDPCRRAYTTAAIWDPLYGLTAFSTNQLAVIFDLVQVKLMVGDQRIDVGSTADITARASYSYDGTSFLGSVILNDTQFSQPNVGQRAYTTQRIVDQSYGLQSFSSNMVSVIFDRVEVVLSSPLNRVQLGSNATIKADATYSFDGQPFSGSILLTEPTLSNSVGTCTYGVDEITDYLHGLSAFTSNQLTVVFDRIKPVQRVHAMCPGRLRVEIALRYESDNTPVEDATVKVNDVVAEYLGNGVHRARMSNWKLRTETKTTISREGFTVMEYAEEADAMGNIVLLVGLVAVISMASLLLAKGHVWGG